MSSSSPAPRPASTSSTLVVGVVVDVPDVVITQAAIFAADLGAGLIFASVEPLRYSVSTLPDGSVLSMPIDPEIPDESAERFDESLGARIRRLIDDSGTPGERADIPYELRALAGDPAIELGRLAADVDARAIVVGTRKPGFRASLEEFFAGSIAVALAHNQSRPILVVPVAAAFGGERWPQQSADDAS